MRRLISAIITISAIICGSSFAFSADIEFAMQSLYRLKEDDVRHELEAMLEKSSRLARPGTTVVELKLAQQLLYHVAYQRLIDILRCHHANLKEGRNSHRTLISCIGDANEATDDMFHFQIKNIEAVSRNGIHDTCIAKSRLNTFERKYPPYQFMYDNASDFAAVDSKSYLRCARERL